ncbi:hypothetical protein HanHA300_Chr03g0107481 [Helianthus annuus]|nr:hypothetical protein HanHA300_Chr03g0107481 [Helianthus annuus]
MADAFEEENEQTVSLNEYLDEVEDQELVIVCTYVKILWNFVKT